MATEQDKTNTAVIATLLAMGAAAMLGGSAAIVGLARSETNDFSEKAQAYADLDAVGELKRRQREQLASGKLPISRAKTLVLAEVSRNPLKASPLTKPPTPAPSATSEAGAAASSGAALGAPPPMGSAVGTNKPGTSASQGTDKAATKQPMKDPFKIPIKQRP